MNINYKRKLYERVSDKPLDIGWKLEEKRTYKCSGCGMIEWEGYKGRHYDKDCKGHWNRYYFPSSLK